MHWPRANLAQGHYCHSSVQMLYIVEYLPIGNLEVAIKRDQERRRGKPRLLGWHMHGRSIASDIARGMAFLHSLKARLPLDADSSGAVTGLGHVWAAHFAPELAPRLVTLHAFLVLLASRHLPGPAGLAEVWVVHWLEQRLRYCIPTLA